LSQPAAINLKLAVRELWDLSDGGHRASLMRQVDGILAGFSDSNRSHSVYVSEKIHDVRTWFDEVGKGGRGKWTFEHARENLRTSIAKLDNVVREDGTGFTC